MKKEFRYNPALRFIREDVKGNLCIDGEYVFQQAKDKLPINKLIQWMLSPNPQRKQKKNDLFKPDVLHHTDFTTCLLDKIVWLGHSSFFIQINGRRLLTDPVFHDLTPFLRRRHAMPCKIDRLQNIDYILLSHGHRDHLDLPTLKKIAIYNPQAEVLAPMGFRSILLKLGFKAVHEAAWWQQYETNNLTITFLPAKHWNRRFLYDYNTTLWGSFAIQSEDSSIYFAGDTGYGHHFKEINTHIGDFDICMMPVGAYQPRYMMEWAHTSPQEAVEAFHELNGKTFIPMHYGTFDLSDEPASEPVQLLNEFYKNNQIRGLLKILKVGEILEINSTLRRN